MVSVWVENVRPSASWRLNTAISSRRWAAILGSNCRREPAAALRGLAMRGFPSISRWRVQFFEHGAGHVHLAPDDEPGQLLRQGHGDGADGSQVLRHVLPDAAVASGGATDEHAVPILQRHGQAVHLRLHAVFGIREGLPDVSQELLAPPRRRTRPAGSPEGRGAPPPEIGSGWVRPPAGWGSPG